MYERMAIVASKRNVTILLLLTLLSVPLAIKSQSAWVDRVMTWTINGEFDKAEDFLGQKIVHSDSALAPCFYLASVLNSKMNYYENQRDATQFENLLKFIIRKSSRDLLQNSQSASSLSRLYFYRGSAYGYLAFFQGQNKQWLAALRNGLRAVDDLQTAVGYDSTLYEAYLGLGTYKYWRSTKLKLALWLPFVHDRREEGIRDIKHALQSPSKSRYMALHQLVYILTDYGKYDDALRYAREGIEAFPHSPFMWWAYAHTYFKAHRYRQAAQAYEHLLRLIETDYTRNRSQWLACQVRLAEVYLRLGDKQKAKTLAEEALARQRTFPVSDLNEKRLQRARTVIARAVKGSD